MTKQALCACIDRVIPDDLESLARVAHAKEHGLGRPSPFELAVSGQKMWKPGRKLRVCFLDGEPIVHRAVAAHAKTWTKHANIIFDFVDGLEGDIRISFKQPGGYWSAVGTDALIQEYFPKGEATMNFEGVTSGTPEDDYAHIVLHEFGHAIGCIHEHQTPAKGIRWNKEVVYRDLGGPPNNWNKQTVDHNMFEAYNRLVTQFTEFATVGEAGQAWSGVATVGRKGEWPGWTPTADEKRRLGPLPNYVAGGARNPMGARALYLYAGGKDTLYRIHGTNQPEYIGRAISSGCIRLTNEDAIDLYSRGEIGTTVVR